MNEVVTITKELAADLKSKDLHCVEDVEEEVVRKVAAYSTCSITSMSAFMGGFVAQEIVKLTGKYMPLK